MKILRCTCYGRNESWWSNLPPEEFIKSNLQKLRRIKVKERRRRNLICLQNESNKE